MCKPSSACPHGDHGGDLPGRGRTPTVEKVAAHLARLQEPKPDPAPVATAYRSADWRSSSATGCCRGSARCATSRWPGRQPAAAASGAGRGHLPGPHDQADRAEVLRIASEAAGLADRRARPQRASSRASAGSGLAGDLPRGRLARPGSRPARTPTRTPWILRRHGQDPRSHPAFARSPSPGIRTLIVAR